MDRLDALAAFVAVAEHKNFAKAARELRISPPAMTRSIGQLEEQLGTTLFHRTTRSVRLTEDGHALLEKARDMLQHWRETEQAMIGRQGEPRGELHITAPVLFGRLHVLPVVTELLTAHPAMTVQMMLLDRNVRVVEEGIDVAVRIGPLEDSSLVGITIGTVSPTVVASPDYLARRGIPRKPEDLARHDVIQSAPVRSTGQWRFGPKSVQFGGVNPRLRVNSLDGVLAAAKAGLGLANLLSYQVAEAVSEGTLCTVLDDAAPPPLPVSLLFPANRSQLPSLRCFIEAMRQRAAAGGWMLPASPEPLAT
jgi:DNA-binding transcriptional LysR family regulator